MTEYDNTNKGQIWGNDKKDTPAHPDFKGSINVEGVEYWLSAWRRDEGGNPKAPSLRFSIQKKEDAHKEGMQKAQQAAQPSAPPQGQAMGVSQQGPVGGDDSFSDEIPF